MRDARVNDGDDPYAGASFVVELHADGLDATRCVFVFGWDGLDGFLNELASSWRGWEGTKTWTSPEGDLHLDADVDHLGHTTLKFTARDGPLPTWRATVQTVVAAGEDMKSLAAAVGELLSVISSP